MKSALEVYQLAQQREKKFISYGIVLCLLFVIMDLLLGSSFIEPGEMMELWRTDKGSIVYLMVVMIRLPATLSLCLMAVVHGFSASALGMVYESKWTTPMMAGLSSIASFGGLVVHWFMGDGHIIIEFIIATVFSLMYLGLLYGIKPKKYQNIPQLGCCLMLFNFAIHGLYFQRTRSYEHAWFFRRIFGGIQGVTWQDVLVLAALALWCLWITGTMGKVLLLYIANPTEDQEKQILRKRFLPMEIAIVIMTSYLTVRFGLIGFVGLTAVLWSRRWLSRIGSRYMGRIIVWTVVVMLFCSILSKLMVPGRIVPVGMVTLLMGALSAMGEVYHSME